MHIQTGTLGGVGVGTAWRCWEGNACGLGSRGSGTDCVYEHGCGLRNPCLDLGIRAVLVHKATVLVCGPECVTPEDQV